MCFITIASVYGLTMGVYEIIHPVGCKDSGLNHFMFWQIVDMNFYNLFCMFFYDLLGFRGEPSCLLFLKNFFFKNSHFHSNHIIQIHTVAAS